MRAKNIRIISIILALTLILGQVTAFASEDINPRLSEIDAIMDAIAPSFVEKTGEWYVLDMSAYDLYSEKGGSSESTVSAYRDSAIETVAKSDASVIELAKAITILKGIGYDAKSLVTSEGKYIDAGTKLRKKDISVYYEAPWALIANLQGNVRYTTTKISDIIDLLKESAAEESGIFEYSYEWDGVVYSGDDIDTTATVLASLAPYYLAEEDKYEVDDFVDRALTVLSEKQLSSGSFGNANSDAMMIIALSALGINPDEDARFIKGENSLLDGILTYFIASLNEFGYMDAISGNELATEQAFRALIAAAGIIKTGTAYNVYDFSNVEANEAESENGGSSATPDVPSSDDLVTVYFALEGRNGATWIPRHAVTIEDDAKVSHVIQKVLDAKGYSYEGLSNGYITKITKPSGSSLAQFDHGANSGWLYKVDEETPNMGISRFGIYPGAEIVLYYTGDWTRDPLAGFGALAASDSDKEEAEEQEIKDKPDSKILAENTAAYIKKTVVEPKTAQVGGEWSVIGLARSGMADRDWAEKYYDSIVETLQTNNGVLHERKYTEYARAALALTSIGVDARSVGGYNIIANLDDYEKVTYQGINGAIFALIAADCAEYELSNREKYVDFILGRQLTDGGFALSGDRAESDVTAMALTALSKYSEDERVKAAIDKAVLCLSEIQNNSGAFPSWSNDTVESTAQVIVALTTLGIPIDDKRFVKEGNTAYDALLTFMKEDGSFSHTVGGEPDMLATEQALYASVAVARAEAGQSSIYDMCDISLGSFSDSYFDDNYEAIEALCKAGIVNGVGDGKFAPEKGITRAEFAAITVRSFGISEEKTEVFSDVSGSEWYAGYVGAAYKNGIINGVSPTSFLPKRSINRVEAAAMVARAAKLAGIDTEVSEISAVLSAFEDSGRIPAWARENVAFCAKYGILKNASGIFNSEVQISRSEMAGMVYEMLKLAQKI